MNAQSRSLKSLTQIMFSLKMKFKGVKNQTPYWLMAGPDVNRKWEVFERFPSDCDGLIVILVMMHLL